MNDETIGVPNEGWPESPFGHGLTYAARDVVAQSMLLDNFAGALWTWGWEPNPDTALPEYFDIGGEA